jgi:nucleolar protein 4
MVESHKKRRLSGAETTEDAEVKIEDTTTTTDVPAQPQAKRTLFVRSLPASATTESLAEHFSQSYVIKHAVVVSDPKTKVSKGFGFVTFADLEDAESALKELTPSLVSVRLMRKLAAVFPPLRLSNRSTSERRREDRAHRLS